MCVWMCVDVCVANDRPLIVVCMKNALNVPHNHKWNSQGSLHLHKSGPNCVVCVCVCMCSAGEARVGARVDPAALVAQGPALGQRAHGRAHRGRETEGLRYIPI